MTQTERENALALPRKEHSATRKIATCQSSGDTPRVAVFLLVSRFLKLSPPFSFRFRGSRTKNLPCGAADRRQDKPQSKAKARQALKLAEIRAALISAGFDTTDKQAGILGVGRSTAWALLNRDKRAGPSSIIIKRILSYPKLPLAVRRKVNEYIEEKIAGLYGHRDDRRRWFRDQFRSRTSNDNEARADVPISI